MCCELVLDNSARIATQYFGKGENATLTYNGEDIEVDKGLLSFFSPLFLETGSISVKMFDLAPHRKRVQNLFKLAYKDSITIEFCDFRFYLTLFHHLGDDLAFSTIFKNVPIDDATESFVSYITENSTNYNEKVIQELSNEDILNLNNKLLIDSHLNKQQQISLIKDLCFSKLYLKDAVELATFYVKKHPTTNISALFSFFNDYQLFTVEQMALYSHIYDGRDMFSGILHDYIDLAQKLNQKSEIFFQLHARDNIGLIKNILTPTTDYWSSVDIPRAWIEIEFLQATVQITGYAIKTLQGYGQLRGWVLEGSNNKVKYSEINRQSENNDLHRSGYQAYYPVKSQAGSISYKYIRFQTLAKTDSDYNVVNILRFELFGIIHPNNK